MALLVRRHFSFQFKICSTLPFCIHFCFLGRGSFCLVNVTHVYLVFCFPISAASSAAAAPAAPAVVVDATMLGGVRCLVRRVSEVTRGITSRDEYEKVSRDIRYNFYKSCMQTALAEAEVDSKIPVGGR